MKKKLLITFGIGAIVIIVLGFMLLSKLGSGMPIDSRAVKSEPTVAVSEFSSDNVVKALQYELGVFTVELKNEKNCTFQVGLSLGYEKEKAEDALKILQANDIQIKQYIESLLSKQSAEKLKIFPAQQNLEIEMINGINKLLKQLVVHMIYKRNNHLDCK